WRDHPQGGPRRRRGAGRRRRGGHARRAGRGRIRREPRPASTGRRAGVSGTHLEHDWFPRALPANVTLGERSWLYSAYAFLHCRSRRPCAVRIGRDSGVYHRSFFDLGPRGEVVIGDYCAVVGAVFACNSRVVIEDYVLVAHEVTFADGAAAIPGDGLDGDGEPPTSVVLGENSWVGARAVLPAGGTSARRRAGRRRGWGRGRPVGWGPGRCCPPGPGWARGPSWGRGPSSFSRCRRSPSSRGPPPASSASHGRRGRSHEPAVHQP